jgi:hypothetical protein
MMELFRSSKSGQKPGGVLTHFGSMLAAAHRFESIFATQGMRTYLGGDTFILLDFYRNPVREQTLEEALKDFVAYAEQKTISKFNVEIKNPLRLTDCWMDDPIGSGGLDIFKDNHQLNPAQKKEVQKLFSPFESVVYPKDVYFRLSPEAFKTIVKTGRTNAIFKREFAKRRERSIAIGEDFNFAARHELVWIDLTLKLRSWSLSNAFDSFVYVNNSEGNGDNSYVTLNDQQVSKSLENYRFNPQKYMDIVKPMFKDYVYKIWEDSKSAPIKKDHVDTYWAGLDPLQFWTPVSP